MPVKKSKTKKRGAAAKKSAAKKTVAAANHAPKQTHIGKSAKIFANPDKAVIEYISGGATAPLGFFAGGVRAGIKSTRKAPDLGILATDIPANAAGVFTKNSMRAASVDRTMALLPSKSVNAVVCNSGCANSCTGKRGAQDDAAMAVAVADALGVPPNTVVTASTGVIGKYLPTDKIKKAIPALVDSLTDAPSGGTAFAKSILTTDLVTKEVAVQVKCGHASFKIGAVAKGSGMIHPNMATMLCFITTDAWMDRTLIEVALQRVVNATFNNLSVDGDASTNDMVVVMANGASGVELGRVVGDFKVFEDALYEVCNEICRKIACDGEGATKHIEINVTGAKTEEEAQLAARKIAASNLMKCAMFGNDPNWGRIACAVGNSAAAISRRNMTIDICGTRVFKDAQPAAFDEEKLSALLAKKNSVKIAVDLGMGTKSAVAHTCDMSYDYVRINAEYKT